MYTINVNYDIVNYCNLNCAGCSHFSPLVKDKINVDINTFYDNMKQLSLFMSPVLKIMHLELIGGEPLLHPQINDIIKISRNFFPDSFITIITNGILLDKMPDDFFNIINENNIIMYIDNYILDKNFKIRNVSKIKKSLLQIYNKFQFDFHYFKNLNNDNKNTLKCTRFKSWTSNCNLLKYNGDLHLCALSANINILNSMLPNEQQYKIIENLDYVNIYTSKFSDFINLKKNKRPFCNYCSIPTKKNWHIYNGENEWIETTI